MFNKMKHMKNEKGLTLIELLAVIVILAIVAAIAIPAIGNIIENSRVKAAKSDAANIISAAQIYFTDNSSETTFSNTTATYANYLADKGTITTFTVTKGSGTTPIKIVATGTAGNRAYKIGTGTSNADAASLAEIKVNDGDLDSDAFVWNP